MADFTPAQRTEWATVHGEALVLAEFLDRRMTHVQWTPAIAAASAPRAPFRARLTGLREARNDMLEMIADLSGTELRELDAFVRARLGTSLDALQGKRLARIAAARERGRLTTEHQVRLVQGRYEEIWDDPSRSEEAAALAALLNEWAARQHARLAKQASRSKRAT